jgi:hypothetical protein
MGVTAGIFLASILVKEMRYLVYIRYLYGCTGIAGPQVRFLPDDLHVVAIFATVPGMKVSSLVVRKEHELSRFLLLGDLLLHG